MDLQFARLMTELAGEGNRKLFLAAALVSRAAGQGHVCLDLGQAAGQILVDEETGEEIEDYPELGQWLELLHNSSIVGSPDQFRPLVLDARGRLYLHRYWEYEKSLTADLRARAAGRFTDPDYGALGKALGRLFPKMDSEKDSDWQKVAAFAALTQGLGVISGGPGTGKTTLVSRILSLMREQSGATGLRVALAAPTGKAAARMRNAVRQGQTMLPPDDRLPEKSLPEASTVHRLLGGIPGSPYFKHNAENPLPVDLVVIDEASMVDLALMSKLLQAIPAGARLILLGDRDQLASVEAGAVLGDICDRGRAESFSKEFLQTYYQTTGERIRGAGTSGGVLENCVFQLTRNYRFSAQSGIGALSRAVNRGEGSRALEILQDGNFPDVAWRQIPAVDRLARRMRAAVTDGFRSILQAEDPLEALARLERFRLLCGLRKGPYGSAALNRLIEEVLSRENLISPDKRWYRGRPVLIVQNDYNLGLFNGDMGVILPDSADQGNLRAFFAGPEGDLRKLIPVRLPQHETAYALTVHKAQGSEFDEVLLVLPDRSAPVLTRELIYTAVTRARERVTIWGSPEVLQEAVSRRTQRSSGLRDALWEF